MTPTPHTPNQKNALAITSATATEDTALDHLSNTDPTPTHHDRNNSLAPAHHKGNTDPTPTPHTPNQKIAPATTVVNTAPDDRSNIAAATTAASTPASTTVNTALDHPRNTNPTPPHRDPNNSLTSAHHPSNTDPTPSHHDPNHNPTPAHHKNNNPTPSHHDPNNNPTPAHHNNNNRPTPHRRQNNSPLRQTTPFIDIISALYVFLYLYTGFTKALNPGGFISAMKHSPLIQDYSEALAILIPVAEILIAILLIIPATRKFGLLAATTLMSIFTVYVIFIISSGDNWPCTCGGIVEQLGWRDHLMLNGGFLVAGAIATILSFKSFIDKKRRSRTPLI